MEGPGKLKFEDGWMEMFSPEEKMHHVFWCPERFPASFLAQWETQNLETDAGLCIVFFAAAARDGRSIFADDLPQRGGHFNRYTQGAIRCYHTSYYANAAQNPDREQTNLRKNPGFHLVQEGPEGIPTKSEEVHTVTLAKKGPHIRLWVDDKKVIDWTDKWYSRGQPHGDGFIGLRQMEWTHFRYRNFRVWALPTAEENAAKDKAKGKLKLTRLTPPDEFCTYGAYATSPESPDGTRIVYTKFPEKPTDDSWGYEAEVWICNSDGENHRKIADCRDLNAHNGAEASWIDDELIVANKVVKGEKHGLAVLDARDGTVVYGPFEKAMYWHSANRHRVLIGVNNPGGDLDEGIWMLDTRTGELSHLARMEDFYPFADRMDTDDPPESWTFAHPEWNTDGSLAAVMVFTDDWSRRHQFFLKPEGDIHQFFGRGYAHPSFYDKDTIYGAHRHRTVLARLDGEAIRTIGGHAKHPHLSPDHRWVAGEVFGENDDVIYVYPRGSTRGIEIDRNSCTDVTRKVKAHINPSWNGSGSRLYYLKGNKDGNAECWYAENITETLSELPLQETLSYAADQLHWKTVKADGRKFELALKMANRHADSPLNITVTSAPDNGGGWELKGVPAELRLDRGDADLLEMQAQSTPGSPCYPLPAVNVELKASASDSEETVTNSRRLTLPVVGSQPSFSAKKIVHKPKIDGKLADAAWNRDPDVPVFGRMDLERSTEPGTQAWASYDDEALYVAFCCDEPRMDALKLEADERDGDVWKDDSVEIMFDPTGKAETYYQLIVSADGVIYDGKKFDNSVDLENVTAQTQVSEAEDAWTAEIKIPWDDVGLDGPPEKAGILLGRNRQTTGEHEVFQFPVSPKGHHQPDHFAVVHFTKNE